MPDAARSLLLSPPVTAWPTASAPDLGRVLEPRIAQEADDGGPVAAGILIGAGVGVLVGLLIERSADDTQGGAQFIPVPLMTIPLGALLGGLIGDGVKAAREDDDEAVRGSAAGVPPAT